MTATDLVTWLRAQLDHDEQIARAALWAGDERWEVLPGQAEPFYRPCQVIDATYDECLVKVQPTAAGEQGVAAHIALWDPARVIAEITAKRAILDRYDLAQAGLVTAGYDPEMYSPETSGLLDALLALAQPYADRDGYRDEWKANDA